MIKRSIVIIALSFIPVFTFAQKASFLERLRDEISDTLARQKGVFAVAFKDLSSGKELLINENESFHAASTMKTPVMIEVFKQAERRKFSLSDSVILRNEFKSIVDSSFFKLNPTDDSEKDLYNHIGERKSIGDLVYTMIIASSNFATNLIIGLVDARNVTNTMRDLGAKDIMVLRGVEDQKAFDNGLINTTTAHDLSLIYEKIARGKAVNKKASDAMIKILMDQLSKEIIPANLPETVKVAHKTGSITGLQHDSGIVILPDGRKYILVLLSKNLEDETAAIKAMANVSTMIYRFMQGK